MKQPATYIMASKFNGVIYIGVTSNLLQRVWQHKSGLIDGFTTKYFVHRLVYFEYHESMPDAIHREKQLKRKSRIHKRMLIESMNPNWVDLYPFLVGLDEST